MGRHETSNPTGVGPAAGQPLRPDEASVLARVERHLAGGRPEEALAAAEGAGPGSAWVDNARAVCYLRLGRPGRAVEILRGLVFHPTGLSVRPDAHPVHQANYATALLLDGNADGFFGVLAGIGDRTHPAVRGLDEAVRAWEAGRTWGERVRSLLGVAGRPVALVAPPGHL